MFVCCTWNCCVRAWVDEQAGVLTFWLPSQPCCQPTRYYLFDVSAEEIQVAENCGWGLQAWLERMETPNTGKVSENFKSLEMGRETRRQHTSLQKTTKWPVRGRRRKLQRKAQFLQAGFCGLVAPSPPPPLHISLQNPRSLLVSSCKTCLQSHFYAIALMWYCIL